MDTRNEEQVTRWQKPLAVEIRMDAEIGSYQPDDDRDAPPIADSD
jgi:hypothetical protein